MSRRVHRGLGAVLRASAAAVCVCALVSCGSTSGASPLAQQRPPLNSTSADVETAITSAPLVSAATQATQQRPRALLVGDSTLLAVERYEVLDVLRGFDYVFSAESCRTLGVPSCGDPPRPPNALETIEAASGPFDIIVVMAGYDEWWTSFPGSFDRVVAASRVQGAEHIVWLTYREGVGYVAPDGATANEAFVRNNQTLRDKVASGAFPDVVIADWFGYSADSDDWLSTDGIHLTPSGARAVADYISRQIAFVAGLACAAPWSADGVVEAPCPDPDLHHPVDDIRSLYP